MGTTFNAIRFTSDGYTLNSVNSGRLLDGIYATHAAGTTTINQFFFLGA